MLYILVGVIALLTLVFIIRSDYWTGKHSNYFLEVQKPTGKEFRNPNIPDASAHDQWFRKLNTL